MLSISEKTVLLYQNMQKSAQVSQSFIYLHKTTVKLMNNDSNKILHCNLKKSKILTPVHHNNPKVPSLAY